MKASLPSYGQRDLDLINRFGVQIGGIRRNGKEIVSPAGTEVVHPGDELLLLGTHNKIREFVEAM
jgi:CPA2 family monovalent cation:H+ antiporter-2